MTNNTISTIIIKKVNSGIHIPVILNKCDDFIDL